MTESLPHVSSFRRSLIGACLVALLAWAGFAAAPAGAVPGAYRVLIVQANCEPPTKLRNDIAATPEVAAVEIFDACIATPSAEQLRGYDLVVSMSNDEYADNAAYGNVLADYVDSGGVVVQFAYDNWEGGGPGEENGPTGRFASGGYEPFLPGDNPNDPVTLGSFDASSPLMQGVAALASDDNTEPALAPGATLIANWSDGRNLIAYKGRVVSVSAYVGDDTGWSGDFARLAVNAVRWLGPQTLRVENLAPGGGSVAATTGALPCEVGGLFCTVHYPRGTQVTLVATPIKGFAFSGFGNACSGPACSLTMDADRVVTATFAAFAPLGKVRRNKKKGTAVLVVQIGVPGELTATGKRIKRKSRASATGGNVKIPIVAKGKAAKRLKESGRAKVGVNVTYTPAGGATTSFTKKILLLRRTR